MALVASSQHVAGVCELYFLQWPHYFSQKLSVEWFSPGTRLLLRIGPFGHLISFPLWNEDWLSQKASTLSTDIAWPWNIWSMDPCSSSGIPNMIYRAVNLRRSIAVSNLPHETISENWSPSPFVHPLPVADATLLPGSTVEGILHCAGSWSLFSLVSSFKINP